MQIPQWVNRVFLMTKTKGCNGNATLKCLEWQIFEMTIIRDDKNSKWQWFGIISLL